VITVSRDEIAAFVDTHMAAFAARDMSTLVNDYAADAIIVSPMFATLQGRPAIEASFKAFFTAFPDWAMHFDATIIDPPHAAIFATAHATHEAEFFGIPGTHRRIEVHISLHWTFADGLIAHERRIYDFTGLLLQIGVLRAKPAKP
jgi:steroid delta-isomerase-like uncharacterized protein